LGAALNTKKYGYPVCNFHLNNPKSYVIYSTILSTNLRILGTTRYPTQKATGNATAQLFSHKKIKSALKPTFIKTSKNDISIDIKNAANKTNTKFECFFDILIFLNPVNNFRRISHRLSKETLPTRQISRNAKCCHINAQVM
jgi:hypothetical protein